MGEDGEDGKLYFNNDILVFQSKYKQFPDLMIHQLIKKYRIKILKKHIILSQIHTVVFVFVLQIYILLP